MMIKFLKNKLFLLITIQVLLLYICIVNTFPSNYVFALGDMYQIFNFDKFINDLSYTWSNYSSGFLPIFPYNIYYYFHYFFSKLFLLDFSQQSFFYFFIFIFGSFWSFYLSLKNITHNIKDEYKYLFSLLYSLNFYVIFNNFINTSSGYAPILFLYLIIPLIFALLNLYINSQVNFKYLCLLGLILFLSNIANGNMAFFIALNFFIFLFLVLIIFTNKKLYLKKIFFFYIIYFLVTLFSVLPQISEMLSINKSFQNGQSVWDLGNWILGQSVSFHNLLFMVFDVSSSYGYTNFFLLFGALPFLTLFLTLFLCKSKDKLVYIFLILLIFCIFLVNKGAGILSNNMIMYIFLSNPILSSLRSFDKALVFMPYFILIITYLNFIKINDIFYRKIVLIFLSLSLLIPSYYFISGKVKSRLSSVYEYSDARYSNLVKIPSEYFSLAKSDNYKKLDYKIFSLPYNVINSSSWSNFTKWGMVGVDPTVQLFDKGYIVMNNVGKVFNWNYGDFWNKQPTDKSNWIIYLSGLLNSKNLIYHRDVYKSFIKQTQEKIKSYEANNYTNLVNKNDYFDFYLLNDNFFLPHFYTPKTVISTNQGLELFPYIVTEEGYKPRSAIYFIKTTKVSTDNVPNIKFNPTELKKKAVDNTPVLEFKKINPTKYRIVVHGAKGEFPVVFSESFHDKWNMYLTEIASLRQAQGKLPRNDILSKYKILNGNEGDQASKGELKSFIDKGWISTLGDGKEKEIKHQKWEDNREKLDYVEKYNVDFISKNFQDTIQNDNLSEGNIFETWFIKPIEDNKNHSIVNGYANSWMIDTNKICNNSEIVYNDNASCIKNADGSYDFEVIVEFWPQRLFYIGLAVSGTTLIGCLSYLAWTWVRGRKEKEEEGDLTIRKLQVK